MKRWFLFLVVLGIAVACTGKKGVEEGDGVVDVSGVVVDWRTGTPIADVQVRSIGILPERSATSGADGTFLVTAVPINGYVILEVSATGYERTQSPPILIEETDLTGLSVALLSETDSAAFETGFSVAELPSRGHILGTVRRDDDSGISGVSSIEIVPVGVLFDGPHFLDAARDPAPAAGVTTSSGAFVFFNVSTGNAAVLASAVGFDFGPQGTLIRNSVWSIVPIGGAGNGSTTPTPTPSGSPTPTPTPGPQSYAADIYPIFVNRGCSTNGNCHAPPTNGGGMRLNQSAAQVYPAVFARCNTTNVDQSLLLVKPLFEATPNHTGGNIFLNVDDPDYRKIHRWITDGALEN